MGLGLLALEISLLSFYPPHVDIGPACSISMPLLPIWMDIVFFFKSIVVRLPFNSISDGSERWLFYDLVVILMWLCEEASHVYLCRHLLWMLDTVLDGSGPSKHLSLSHKPDP